MELPKLNRDLHRWGSILALLPMAIIIVSGIILQTDMLDPRIWTTG